LRVFRPARVFHPLDHLIATWIDGVWNWAFPNAIESGFLNLHLPGVLKRKKAIPGLKGTQDFFGVNYYSRDQIAFDLREKAKFRFVIDPKTPKTDLQWEIYPEGLYLVLKWIHQRYPRLKIRITENGAADHRDRFRAKFLHAHLDAVQKAIREGVVVESYDHWSLLDNFEWSEGFEPRFGLCEVDYKTFKRTPRPSFYEYQKIIRRNKNP
jgi:beta-glucosidase